MPDARLRPAKRLAGTDPRSVAAYLDEPAIAHFARELDEAAVRTATADQGDGPFDVHVIECPVAGGYGGDAAAADAVTAWIAETLRRGIPTGKRRAGIPRTPGCARPAATRSAGWCADGSDGGGPLGCSRSAPSSLSNGADSSRRPSCGRSPQLAFDPDARPETEATAQPSTSRSTSSTAPTSSTSGATWDDGRCSPSPVRR